ncbi:MAG TPA: SDR family oxidoreductase [Actinomycetota bacterium]|nr:SDR family oxidoreductase [Actinomycetota bacterium]
MESRVVVVTGASSGLGRRTALDLAAEGHRVCVAARREERLTELVDEMGGTAAGHSSHVTDVSDRAQVKTLATHVRDTYGRCDVLINNAGIPGRETFGPDAVEKIQDVMNVNFYGAVFCTAELYDLLLASTPSHVINVTSVAGRIATPGFASYSASKFALVGWTESLQPELAKKGIYVSSIEPGFIPTEGFPQESLTSDPMLSRILGTDADVSAAIRDAIAHRKPQRVVPRWYYLLQVPKLLAPPVYRFVLNKVMDSPVAKKVGS